MGFDVGTHLESGVRSGGGTRFLQQAHPRCLLSGEGLQPLPLPLQRARQLEDVRLLRAKLTLHSRECCVLGTASSHVLVCESALGYHWDCSRPHQAWENLGYECKQSCKA